MRGDDNPLGNGGGGGIDEELTMKIRLVLLLLTIFLSWLPVVAQKTVRVREYRRKDGTVVRAHDRRAPRSRPTIATTTPPDYDSIENGEWEPYEVVDLGAGSTYTPGGTGIIRLRWATAPGKPPWALEMKQP